MDEKVKIVCGFEEAPVLDENGKPKPLTPGHIEISREEYEKREKYWLRRVWWSKLFCKIFGRWPL